MERAQIKAALQGAGALDGVLIDACSFGNNNPDSFLPSNVTSWALAYERDVDWSNSAFFSINTIEWLYYYDPSFPETSEASRKRFDLGLRTARRKGASELDLTDVARTLGATFHWRKQRTGWTRWQCA